MSCLVPSSHLSYAVYMIVQESHSYIHAFMHPNINTFMHSCIHASTNTHINSRIMVSVAQGLVRSYLINSIINLPSGKSYITDSLRCLFVFLPSGKSYITDSLRSICLSSKRQVLHNGQLEIYFRLPSKWQVLHNGQLEIYFRFFFQVASPIWRTAWDLSFVFLPSGKSHITDSLRFIFSVFQAASPT